MHNAINIDDIRTPTIITGPNPYFFASTDEIDAEKNCIDVCTEPIQATLLSVELNSFVINPKLSPKLILIPVESVLLGTGSHGMPLMELNTSKSQRAFQLPLRRKSLTLQTVRNGAQLLFFTLRHSHRATIFPRHGRLSRVPRGP